MHPSRHLHGHYFPFLVGAMPGGHPQFPFGITHWIDHSHELLILFPFVPLVLKILPYLAINLYEILEAQSAS